MNFLLILNLINCTENDLTKENSKPIAKITRKKRNTVFRSFKPGKYISSTPKPPNRSEIKCYQHSDFKYLHFDLGSLYYSTIFNLSYYFYEELIKHPEFLETCEKIGLDVLKDLPSKELFKNFVIKFVIRKDFVYEKTKANKFMQSIAWKVHKHIVNWSQTHLTSYMFNEWSIVWQNIIDSIHIKTDKHCYWRVDMLFDKDQLEKTNKQLDLLVFGIIPYPTLFRISDIPKVIAINNYAIKYLVDPSTRDLIN